MIGCTPIETGLPNAMRGWQKREAFFTAAMQVG